MKLFNRLSIQTILHTVIATVLIFGYVTITKGQTLELRRPFERFETGKIHIGGDLLGPVRSQLDSSARINIALPNALADFNGIVSIDVWQFRAGLRVSSFTKGLSPFIFWNPVIDSVFGGDGSRWGGTLGWENIFTQNDDYDPRKILQPDNSIYDPRNSFSLMVSYWFGSDMTDQEKADLLRKAYPVVADSLDMLDQKNNTLGSFDNWVNMLSKADTNYMGRGVVDTNNYRTPPYDTNTYVRGPMPVGIMEPEKVYYTDRNGFSALVGLGTGKYAGSGPISKFLNFVKVETDSTDLKKFGINPMAAIRYRYNHFIGQIHDAGEDLNAGILYSGLRDFDFEAGAKYLEHLFPKKSDGSGTREGINQPEFFLGIKFAPPFTDTYTLYEIGDKLFSADADTDGDGLTDVAEMRVTGTDPRNPDTDGDGVPDGLEVLRYRSNPLNPDTDGDGLTDGQALLSRGCPTDPLRPDTDGDGMNDGEEVLGRPTVPGERGK